ncbi:MAG: metallophosphoesterase, partial [Chloroflexi bacterium]|nr:metallophosphoesterase [Chloroflexota bacterium]
VPQENELITLTGRAILNPGSVGQPRDHDPRACFAFYYPDESAWELRRVEYDISAIQERIQQEQLPKRHAQRLSQGW